jgi:DNA (cytosine-5)-methyltransferase 1
MSGATKNRVVSVDLFAGGGGASEGIREATGFAPVIAVNHDEDAIFMHARNHPGTMHLCENVLDVDPIAPNGRLDLLWASPDCTFFSRARGGKPMDKNIRALPWVAIKWARYARPSVIGMENVAEIMDWGPLHPADHPNPKLRDRPIKERKGETFKEFIQALRDCGYDVEWRVLKACDYGAPTTRERFFLIARSDGHDIVWPEPTHGPGRAFPYRTASECIDWNIPCPSIFLDSESAKQLHVRRPLADKTLARIAEGIRRFVVEAQQPFLLNLTHGGRLEPLDAPMRTITAANRGEKALVTPYLATIDHQSSSSRSCVAPTDDPLSTITSKNRHILVAPYLVETRNGERPGQRPRCRDLQRPLNTITAKGSQGAVVTAHLEPMDVLPDELVSPFLVKYYGQGVGQDVRDPLHTITNRARFGLVHAFLSRHGVSSGEALDMATVHIHGVEYAIVDIGMRMLTPRELARAQGFPEDYILTGSKSVQIAKIGNSVPPPIVAALIGAQFGMHPHEMQFHEVA